MTILNANPRVRRAALNIHPALDGFFNELMNSPVADIAKGKTMHSNSNRPAANISEEKNLYKIELAIPGIPKENVQIAIDKDILKISSTAEPAKKAADIRVVKAEFDFSKLERSFRLPKTVDRTNISAKTEDGILSITLPKKEEAIEKAPISIKVK